MINRIILIILDSVGMGEMADAESYGDKGSNTLGNISKKLGEIKLPNLSSLGFGNIDGMIGVPKNIKPQGAFGKCAELSKGKDTVTGHWEMAGVILDTPLNTYPNGFSKEIIKEFEEKIGTKTLGNIVASGTEIIKDLGFEHESTGYPIVYTSADSVFQIAASEDIIPLENLYHMCEIAREMLVGDKMVGRVIARPFINEGGTYTRTANRRDYALDPFEKTMLEYIKENNKAVMAVGKIEDIYNKKGVTQAIHTKGNMDGVDKTIEYMKEDKQGLIFTNLVDFDALYGHRNDPAGYKRALEEFDLRLPEILKEMNKEDVLIISADHGCDPTTESTDHSREYIPLLVYGAKIEAGVNLGTRSCFCDIGKTILDLLTIENTLNGTSFIKEISKS